jgi:hypothetical protein
MRPAYPQKELEGIARFLGIFSVQERLQVEASPVVVVEEEALLVLVLLVLEAEAFAHVLDVGRHRLADDVHYSFLIKPRPN